MNRHSIISIGLLSGTVIGAGVFSLPYVFSMLGIITGLIYLVFFAAVYAVLYIMYASLIRKEAGKHDFFFLAKKYLPKAIYKPVRISVFGGLIFALVVYIALIPSFFSFALGMNGGWIPLAFWAFSSVFFFVKAESLGIAESVGTIGIICAVFALIFASFFLPSFPVRSLPSNATLTLFFLPFGPILFSFAGRSAISRIVVIWKNSGKSFSINKSIIAGIFIPAVVYIFFILSVLLISPSVTEDAISGLYFLPFGLRIVLGVIGFLTLWTSYIMLGTNIRDILLFDTKLSKALAFGLPIVCPLLLFVSGFNNFLTVLSIAGGIFVSFESIAVVWMWTRAYPKNRWKFISIPLLIVFEIAFVYSILEIFI